MHEIDLRQIPLAALFLAVGVVLPQFFHLLGLGAAFLPMFLPVMTGAMLLRWKFAILPALFSPLISFMITGMPPLAPPVLPIIIVELVVVASLISLLRVHNKRDVWTALLIAIIVDRLLLFLLVWLILPLFGLEHPLFSLALVSTGIPGIVLQLITIPLVMKLIRDRFPHWYDLKTIE